MTWRRPGPAGLLLLALLPAASGQDDPDALFTQTRLEAIAKEARAMAEKATGAPIARAPSISLITPPKLAELLAVEILPQIRLQMPGASEGEAQAAAKEIAVREAPRLLGKYAPATNSIFIVRETFVRQARELRDNRTLSHDYVRMVVTHEMVHAADEQAHSLHRRVAAARTAEEIAVFAALSEGHAEHVTRLIMAERRQERLFDDYEKFMTSLPPGLSEGERHVVSRLVEESTFAYVKGRLFFEALALRGRKGLVQDAFRSPPRTRSEILHPERYLATPGGTPPARDLGRLWEGLRASRGPGWTSLVSVTGEVELRADFGDFAGKAPLDAAMAGLRAGHVCVLRPKKDGDPGAVRVAVCEMDGASSAAKLFDVAVDASKAKDRRLTQGPIRILRAEYGTLTSLVPMRYVASTKSVASGSRVSATRTIHAQFADFYIEASYAPGELTDEPAAAVLRKIREFLETR